MLIAAVATVRRILTLAWGLVLLGLIGLAVFTRLNDTYVIRGASMEPRIPLGSLVVLEPVEGGELRPGDVVTIRADNGVIVTHRVTRVLAQPDGDYLEIKGDANETPDPNLIPMRAVQGRVASVAPVVGYLAAMLGTASGLVSLLALLAAGMLAIWALDEFEEELLERRLLHEAAEREAARNRRERAPLARGGLAERARRERGLRGIGFGAYLQPGQGEPPAGRRSGNAGP